MQNKSMKIILSPSKNQNRGYELYDIEKLDSFRTETHRLFECLKGMSKEELGLKLKIKGDLLEETYKRYQDYNPNALPMIHAIEGYTGVVYEGLELKSYKKKENNYLHEHIRILSAMYGVLEPRMMMANYRLDMTIKLPDISLTQLWKPVIEEYFKDTDIIIDLASLEFSRLLKKYEDRMLHIEFYERQADDSLKVISYNAKKARGLMANTMIRENIKDLKKLKTIEVMSYRYCKELSDARHYKYIKIVK